jgi:Flp pilus assembly protein TadG
MLVIRFGEFIMKKQNLLKERGQSLIIIAFAAIGLFAFTALAIDGGMVFSDRRHSQNASDTAALAAALARARGNANWEQAALDRAQVNEYSSASGSTVEVYLCSDANATCTNLSAGTENQYVQVRITSNVKLFFARIIGWQQVTNHTEAVARAGPSDYKAMFNGNAVIGLAPHDCHAVTYQGNANTSIDGGGIFVMSDCPDAAFFNHSGAAQLSAPSLCSVGGIQYNPGALNVPSISQGCSPPSPIVEPNPTCTGNAVKTGNTLSPGNWTGHFPPAGVDTLQSGIYCVDGDFRLNGGDSLTGYGVVLRMDSGVVVWNGGATVHLAAPDAGAFSGLLLYLPSATNCSSITLNGNSGSTIVGTVLAPCSNISIDGTGDSGIEGQIIGYTVDLSGTSSNSIHYDDSHNYDALTQPNIQMTQ